MANSEYGNTESNYFNPTATTQHSDDENQERATVKAALPFIEGEIARLEARITFYDTLSSVVADVSTTPEEHLRQCIANTQTKANLQEEKHYIQTLYDTYK